MTLEKDEMKNRHMLNRNNPNDVIHDARVRIQPHRGPKHRDFRSLWFYINETDYSSVEQVRDDHILSIHRAEMHYRGGVDFQRQPNIT